MKLTSNKVTNHAYSKRKSFIKLQLRVENYSSLNKLSFRNTIAASDKFF